MANEPESTIYRSSAICAMLAALPLIVPRFVPNPEGGVAAGTSAAMALFGMLTTAFVVSLFLPGMTIKRYGRLFGLAPAVGLSPAIVLGISLLSLFLLLGY